MRDILTSFSIFRSLLIQIILFEELKMMQLHCITFYLCTLKKIYTGVSLGYDVEGLLLAAGLETIFSLVGLFF